MGGGGGGVGFSSTYCYKKGKRLAWHKHASTEMIYIDSLFDAVDLKL